MGASNNVKESENALEQIRDKIDELDRNLLKLLHQRFRLTRQVGIIKRRSTTMRNIHIEWREEAILKRVEQSCGEESDGLSVENGRRIFESIFAASRQGQKALELNTEAAPCSFDETTCSLDTPLKS